MATRHVIIGAGPAGLHAIATIRKYDSAGSEIHLVCDEPAYSRMALPYWLAGEIEREHTVTADEQFFQHHGVTTHIGRRAVKVDPNARQVTCDDGQTLEFDTLLIATGSSPTRPDIPGVDSPGAHTLWTVSDAESLMQRTGKGKHVLFVGGGFIGFIVLNALYKVGCRLTVVEAEQQILPHMLESVGADIAAKWLDSKGVQVHTGTTVTAIQPAGDSLSATLSNGQTLQADAIVVSTGVKPNVEFLRDSGIRIEDGIVVDDHLRTNYPSVYAAGDCAQGPDLLGGQPAVHAIEPTAIEHGRVAGANMAGRDVPYDGSLRMNVLELCGLQAASFGRWDADGPALTVRNDSRPAYRKLILDGDRIVGAVLLGRCGDLSTLNDMGMVKGFVQTQTPLGQWKGYLERYPLDIRRPYIGCQVASKLLSRTLLPEPAAEVGYRFQNARPDSATDRGPHHALFCQTWQAAQQAQ